MLYDMQEFITLAFGGIAQIAVAVATAALMGSLLVQLIRRSLEE
ncbi:MAG TPA: hypothetical protein PLD47_13890 [Aggregatilineales bacterium]|nr:MAG: hypothetical protein HKUEN02_01110 [Anaerolineaceae bacterium]HRE48813.1 hypothetical protein [Aggregatilineales bacterium]